MKTLKDLLLNELADMYGAERQVVKALPRLAKAATSDNLRQALASHAQESAGHVKKLEQVFRCFDAPVKSRICKATTGLLKEGDALIAEFKGSPTINAAVICAAQKIEHYEMASYGCLHEWAGLLGTQEAVELLEDILDDERAANESFTRLARASSNDEAMAKHPPMISRRGRPANMILPRSPAPRRGVRPFGLGLGAARSLVR